jgi:hypothetical protein
MVLWDMKPRSLVDRVQIFYPEHRSNMLLRNVSTLVPSYTASHPRMYQTETAQGSCQSHFTTGGLPPISSWPQAP